MCLPEPLCPCLTYVFSPFFFQAVLCAVTQRFLKMDYRWVEHKVNAMRPGFSRLRHDENACLMPLSHLAHVLSGRYLKKNSASVSKCCVKWKRHLVWQKRVAVNRYVTHFCKRVVMKFSLWTGLISCLKCIAPYGLDRYGSLHCDEVNCFFSVAFAILCSKNDCV